MAYRLSKPGTRVGWLVNFERKASDTLCAGSVLHAQRLVSVSHLVCEHASSAWAVHT